MITNFIEKYKTPKYRIDQFNQFYYSLGIESFDEIINWPLGLKEKLKKEVEFTRITAKTKLISLSKDTYKILFSLDRDPKKKLETVLMRHKGNRNTVCVSCMVGCPVNCSFCATGKMGFQASLTAEEIVDQVLYFQRILVKEGQRVTNVVFMGMGEPMLNLEEVQKSVKILNDPMKLNISQRKITISTSGYVTQFKKFVAEGFRTRIAISLHAPNQELRAKMMPVAKQFPLDVLMEALDDYVALTNKRVSYEYVMLKGVNDTEDSLRDLISLLKGRLAHVNLIPYNKIKEVEFERSQKEWISTFARRLNDAGIHTTIRVTMGDDINAACGQLADRESDAYQKRQVRTQEKNTENPHD